MLKITLLCLLWVVDATDRSKHLLTPTDVTLQRSRSGINDDLSELAYSGEEDVLYTSRLYNDLITGTLMAFCVGWKGAQWEHGRAAAENLGIRHMFHPYHAEVEKLEGKKMIVPYLMSAALSTLEEVTATRNHKYQPIAEYIRVALLARLKTPEIPICLPRLPKTTNNKIPQLKKQMGRSWLTASFEDLTGAVHSVVKGVNEDFHKAENFVTKKVLKYANTAVKTATGHSIHEITQTAMKYADKAVKTVTGHTMHQIEQAVTEYAQKKIKVLKDFASSICDYMTEGAEDATAFGIIQQILKIGSKVKEVFTSQNKKAAMKDLFWIVVKLFESLAGFDPVQDVFGSVIEVVGEAIGAFAASI
ncbi:uncharacterized protein LOC135396041 isoform X2 [Ornithodoros turicata]|uniref:uncharacterized protein LOC135396041 isoform X2 n=1 Tax=Ornithodoros turicata TaxID=34597 RepID=UPI00313A3F2B